MRGAGKKKLISEKIVDGWKIHLTQGYFTFVSDEDIERVSNQKWHVVITKGRKYVRGYKKENGKFKGIFLHRYILGLTNPKTQVDHIDGNGLNNRRNNLRSATHIQNCQNKLSVRSKTGIRGVYKAKNGWVASICVNRKLMHLGYFKEISEAQKTRKEAEEKYFQEFAPIK